jgi:hypothetical protein
MRGYTFYPNIRSGMQCVTLNQVLTNQRYEVFNEVTNRALKDLQSLYSCVEDSFFRLISTALEHVSHYLYYAVHAYVSIYFFAPS